MAFKKIVFITYTRFARAGQRSVLEPDIPGQLLPALAQPPTVLPLTGEAPAGPVRADAGRNEVAH